MRAETPWSALAAASPVQLLQCIVHLELVSIQKTLDRLVHGFTRFLHRLPVLAPIACPVVGSRCDDIFLHPDQLRGAVLSKDSRQLFRLRIVKIEDVRQERYLPFSIVVVLEPLPMLFQSLDSMGGVRSGECRCLLVRQCCDHRLMILGTKRVLGGAKLFVRETPGLQLIVEGRHFFPVSCERGLQLFFLFGRQTEFVCQFVERSTGLPAVAPFMSFMTITSRSARPVLTSSHGRSPHSPFILNSVAQIHDESQKLIVFEHVLALL